MDALRHVVFRRGRWQQRSCPSSNPGTIVINKSTVPGGTTRGVAELIGVPASGSSRTDLLREGRSVYDFLRPDRIVVGAARRRPMHDAALAGSDAGDHMNPASEELVK